MIKVQLEFHSVPEAIIALNAIMNLPEVKASPVAATVVEAKAARRGRADKGQKRGEYKPREPNAAPREFVEPPQVAAGENPLERATDISQGRDYAGVGGKTKAPARANPDVPEVAAPIAPAEVVKAEIQKQQAEHAPVPATIGEKDADAQKAMEVLHGKKGLDACRVLLGQFGVGRIREIPTARRAEFLEEAKQAAA